MSRTCVLPVLALSLLLLLPSLSSLPSAEKLNIRRLDLQESGKHDPNLDKEMLMGKSEASMLSSLDKPAAERRLRQLFHDIDTNKDGKVDRAELIAWLHKAGEKQLIEEVDRQWKDLNVSAEGKLKWSDYANSEIPFSMSPKIKQLMQQQLKTSTLPVLRSADAQTESDKQAIEEFSSELGRKRNRWERVDADKDGMLSKQEFQHFLFPEEFPETRDLAVEEEMERQDKNGDGRVTLDEFLRDMWNPTKGNEEKEPDWVETERKDFQNKKDQNKDGYLDRKEVAAYLLDQQHKEHMYNKEADHLMKEADKNRDGSISKDEMVQSLEEMANSPVTGYGDSLRDEL